jgi:hypothetical protein
MTSQALGAAQDDTVPNDAASHADAYVSEMYRQGMHCRSSFSGGNESAVSQLRARNGGEIRLLETTLSAAQAGRHDLLITFIVDPPQHTPQIHEARGWVDQETCVAHLS